jgi:archaellum component FlaC
MASNRLSQNNCPCCGVLRRELTQVNASLRLIRTSLRAQDDFIGGQNSRIDDMAVEISELRRENRTMRTDYTRDMNDLRRETAQEINDLKEETTQLKNQFQHLLELYQNQGQVLTALQESAAIVRI